MLGQIQAGHGKAAVHQHVLGGHAQPPDGALHGQQAGLQDVELIYFGHSGQGHVPGQGLLLDGGGQGLALPGGELFGVFQAGQPAVGRQDDGGRHYGAGQGAAPGFVHAGDVLYAALPEELVG